ncbi:MULTISPECIES: DGQHR domain-containing protein DpdB [Rhizobium/Agrobacterium group]|nr:MULTISPECIES: DGQHR domain-containing protein DpdB [Rhizobium/Agrobacterium group]MCF1475065.1 DGQHR domain-containing protein [Allorhizobium ampelinum]MVA52721.1 DGQHR domain-containing protein [Agrobacterium vitis]NSZ55476.1 DGQHR domain-containing protein [Agrobacterium vitis]NTA34542.1 DGQHR domain-containing protein [Agrobacterium vitis]
MTDANSMVVRAVRTQQGYGTDVYAFFLPGSAVMQIAEISRIKRDEAELQGFQRQEIRSHVNSIVEFLNSGPVLFPNAIILALSEEVEFKAARGTKPSDMIEIGTSGTLHLPIGKDGKKIAWIVDGQQRSIALSRAENKDVPVPVIAFVSQDLEVQRQQFILVNKVKALDTRLINELLPEVSSLLPRDLAANKLPSELCNLLNSQKASPFFQLIKRRSDQRAKSAVVSDSALIAAIKINLKAPSSALSQYLGVDGACDADEMFHVLVKYWSAVRDTFPDAWGLAPEKSRLMHMAGIRAMGALMDPIMVRADSVSDGEEDIRRSLARLRDHCCWTSGKWDELGWKWNEVQGTQVHIERLTQHLILLDRKLSKATR